MRLFLAAGFIASTCLTQAQPVQEAVAESPVLPPGQTWIFQVLSLAAQLLMYGGLVSVLAVVIRRVLVRSRLSPQGRWTRGILTTTGALLLFVPFAGIFLWVVNQPDGARLVMYGALLALLVLMIGGYVHTIRAKLEGLLGRVFMISLALFLVGAAASGGMFDWVLSLPSKHFANRDWANQPGTLTKVGQAAPELEVTTLDGGRVNLADLRGKVVVLNFFATWCGPCQQEMPALEQKVWQPFKKKPLTVISINCKETDEKVKGFRQKHGCTFSMATDLDGSVYAKYATQGIPRTYVIDRNGIIAYQCTGFWAPEMENMIKVVRKELRQVTP